MGRRFTKKEQEEMARTLLRHRTFLSQPYINLELTDGELVETGGNWRDEKFRRTETDNAGTDDE